MVMVLNIRKRTEINNKEKIDTNMVEYLMIDLDLVEICH
jgi:hypothetical protein